MRTIFNQRDLKKKILPNKTVPQAKMKTKSQSTELANNFCFQIWQKIRSFFFHSGQQMIFLSAK